MQRSDQSVKRIILVVGPPGSGKGTQCEILAKKTGLTHINVGDLVRDAIKNKTEFGKIAEPYTSTNKPVPDGAIISAVFERLTRDPNESIILDGFPRTLDQAMALIPRNDLKVERLLIVEASDEVCMKRLHDRNDPRRNDKDEKKRSDKLKFYRDNFKNIIELFKGKIQLVNGNDEQDKVAASIDELMSQEPLKGGFDSSILNPVNIKRDSELCIVCMTKAADHLVLPCGHQCGCEDCLLEVKRNTNQCPICRNPFTDVIKVVQGGAEEETKVNKLEKKVSLKRGNSVFNDVKEFEIKNEFDDQELTKKIIIAAAPCEKLKEDSKDPVNIGISITVPDIECRIPIDVCCVIDVSGSMDEDVKYQDPENENKVITDGLSQLDLVKHAVKTVIKSLTDKDRLSLVAFSTKAKLVYPAKFMTQDNKLEAVEALDPLEPDDTTNIWDGLKVALNSLLEAEDKKHRRRKFVFLLTDGQPNVSPNIGEARWVESYLRKHPDTAFQINTFGFGYKLDSEILLGISAAGGGAFGFIPDAKLLGTNFVNCVANAATTLCVKAKLHLTPLEGSTLAKDLGENLSFEKQDDHIVVELGNLQLGQTRDIVIPMHLSKGESYLAVTLEYESQEEGHIHKLNYTAKSRTPTVDSVAAWVRSRVINQTYKAINEASEENLSTVQKMMEDLSKFAIEYDNKYENEHPCINGLVADLVGFGGKGGRMSKAISTKERYYRWGAHYLRSIARAYELQLRTNFMDIGLQAFGGKTFEALQNIGGQIFLSLPLNRTREIKVNYIQQEQDQPQPQPLRQPSMQIDTGDYYGGGGGGCFDGSCVVDVLDENGHVLQTPIKNLKKGDLVCVQENQTAKILAVVRIQLDERESLVEFNSSKLRLTQKHPVFYENKWQNPIDIVNQNKNIARISPPTPGAPNYVYNLVLEHTHVLKVNDMFCVTLGHGIQEAYHPFYGTNAVVNVLKASKDFEKGFISVKGNIRNLAPKIVETEKARFENENSQVIHI